MTQYVFFFKPILLLFEIPMIIGLDCENQHLISLRLNTHFPKATNHPLAALPNRQRINS